MSIILQHKSSPVNFDRPRTDPRDPQVFPGDSEIVSMDIMETLNLLIKVYGATRVMSWVRNLAAIQGQGV